MLPERTEKRINIGPMARQFRERGFLTHSEVVNQDENSIFGEANAWRAAPKQEIYALNAVLIDRIVTRASSERANRPPYGLLVDRSTFGAGPIPLDRFDLDNPFNTVQVAMFATLLDAKDVEFSEMVNGTAPDTVMSVYNRLNSLGYLLNDGNSIEGGMDFACVVMSAIAEGIPRVSPDVNNPNVLTDRARNSYPLVLKLASANMEYTAPMLYALTTPSSRNAHFPRFYSDSFIIKEVGEKAQLVISKEGDKRLKRRGIEDLSIAEIVGWGPTIGCPALVNFGEGSAVKTLWDWYVDIAEQIYPILSSGSKAQ